MSYSQSKEDLMVLRYFKDHKGNLLSVGENDGQTFSNANLLIQHGWSAWLIEPASVFDDLRTLHEFNPRVKCYNYGIGEDDQVVPFYESANHVRGGSDRALVSSVDVTETERWRKAGVEFTEKNIQLKSFASFWEEAGKPNFDFISIDCEGMDWLVLQQINLDVVGCKVLCIEWNGVIDLGDTFTLYCRQFGLRLAHQNNENLIFAR